MADFLEEKEMAASDNKNIKQRLMPMYITSVSHNI